MAAAYAAGLLSADEAIIAAYYRGRVAKDVNSGGAMMAVGLGAEAAEAYLAGFEGKVVVACHNSPALVTLSGDEDALESVKVKLDADGVFARPVKTNGKAYHSHHMAPVAPRYEKFVRAAKAERIAGTPHHHRQDGVVRHQRRPSQGCAARRGLLESRTCAARCCSTRPSRPS